MGTYSIRRLSPAAEKLLLNWLKMTSPSSGPLAASAAPAGNFKAIPPHTTSRIGFLLQVATWFGLVAGFGEGFGLLIFQRINWTQWARVMHVSKEILWISPVVDLSFFLLIGFSVALLSRIFTRLPGVRVLAFVLIFLTVYDWLMLSGHFYRRAALIFALGAAVAFNRWFGKREYLAIRIWNRSVLWLVFLLGAVFIGIEGGKWVHERYLVRNLPAAAPNSPNIVVIVVDTLRADHLASYGYSRATSPNIDRLAQQGVLFENAIAPSSWSLPSHASLVTGCPVHDHGLGNVKPMPWFGWGSSSLNALPTLGEALHKAGYRTGAFSANRIYFTSNVGLGRGFIHFEDYFDGVGDSFVRTEFGREFARLYMNRSEKSKFTRAFRDLGLGSWLDKDSEGSGDYGGIYGIRKRADEVNRETLRWIARDRRHPFFAMLNYLDVHFGYGGPVGYPKPAWDHGTTIDEYDAGIKYTDDYIGQLLHGLDELGELKNTIVIVTSDHGESLGDHGLSFHGAALYWELVHVPLIISWRGHIPEGVRVGQPVSNLSIASTVADSISEKENSFHGPSLAEAWNGNSATLPYVTSELPQTNTIVAADRAMQGKIPIATDGWMKSVVSPEWQLIVHEKYGGQIYNWRTDPHELNNLANTSPGRAAIADLTANLSRP
ncbi:MAG TPA: sulfatase [Terriglobales bacterium]|nr:sulfatase [Terriglobales bacterium]